MTQRIVFFLLLTGTWACQPTPPPKPALDVPASANRPPLPAAPSAPSATPGDECERAYEHLRSIGCTPSAPESGTWQDVCRNGRAHGVFALGCINDAQTIEQAQKCGVCTATSSTH